MKILSIILLSAILIGGIVYKFFLPTEQPLVTTLVYPKAKLLPNFNLIDHNAKSFTHQQLKGKWSVVFFGFTYCPDVCPTTMAALSQIANKLPPEIMKQLQFVFVSVDPERDTPERLAQYIPFYHADFIALTGDDKQLQEFSLSLGAVYMKVPTDESYTMSHSSRLFIIDPKGQRYGIFSKSDSGAINIVSITQDLETIINQ
jgi:protein SCO1/2